MRIRVEEDLNSYGPFLMPSWGSSKYPLKADTRDCGSSG